MTLRRFLNRIRQYFTFPVLNVLEKQEQGLGYAVDASRAEAQRLLVLKYREHAHRGLPLPTFRETGFSVFSQSDEDGVLLYIFALIGTADGKIVDLGSADIRGSNSANLIINHGWQALLIDGNKGLIERALQFYQHFSITRLFPPRLLPAWITAENINNLIAEHGFTGEIDLLSIDLDGMDYWIWKALTCVNPRVVVVEYQDIIGPDKALTVPYRPDFVAKDYPINRSDAPNYAGASLLAFVKLAREKGYRLVGCNRHGYNAFFVRNDLDDRYLPEVPVASCFTHPLNLTNIKQRWPKVKDMEWVEV